MLSQSGECIMDKGMKAKHNHSIKLTCYFPQKLDIARRNQFNPIWITNQSPATTVEPKFEMRPLSTIDVYSDSISVNEGDGASTSVRYIIY